MIEGAARASQSVTDDVRQAGPLSRYSRILLGWSLALLLAVQPFETAYGVHLAGLLLTLPELMASITLLLWGALLLRQRRLPAVVPWLAASVGLFIGLLLLSALLASQYRFDAIKFTLRQAEGALLALCLAERVHADGWPMVRSLLLALIAGGAVSAALGLWEMTESPLALQILSPFKTQLSLMSGMLRLSATFSYANIAAMYYEALLPVALVASLGLLRGGARLVGVAATVLLLVAAMLTYSRVAPLVCAVTLVAVPLLVLRRWGRGRLLWQALGLSAGLIAVAVIALLGSPTMRLRFSAFNVVSWYDAEYQPAPMAPMQVGEVRSVAISVKNTGQATWSEQGPRPVMLSYHWLDVKSGAVVIFEGLRTHLLHPVAPGETLDLLAQVRAPAQPGPYLLAWDLVRENGAGWFSEGDTPTTRVPVAVERHATGPSQPVAPLRPQIIPTQPPEPPRAALWAVAIQLWKKHPLLGIGPDVFRHIYGPYLGIQRWDDRIHTNNLYLEVLTGGGLLGLAAFGMLLATVLYRALRILVIRPSPTTRHSSLVTVRWWCLVASTLGLTAFLVHGLLDVFLEFTATYVLFWAWVGVTVGLAE